MDPLSRQASQNAMGPWFVRDESSPFRPGCSYDTLQCLIAKGRVTGGSVIRGPSTRQFWTRATSVPGVAHLLGECHACHGAAEADETRCRGCGASFECSGDRQAMGLAPVRLLPGHAAAEEIARSMVDAVKYSGSPVAVDVGITPAPFAPQARHPEAAAASFVGAGRRGSRRSGKIALIVMLVALILILIGGVTAWLAAPASVGGAIRRMFGASLICSYFGWFDGFKTFPGIAHQDTGQPSRVTVNFSQWGFPR